MKNTQEINKKEVTGTSKISSKYQIVIPKAIRYVLRDSARPGTKVYLSTVAPDAIKIQLKEELWSEKYAGILKRGVWGKDPAKYISKMRDEYDRELKRKLHIK